MNMEKYYLKFALLLICLIGLSGCGGSGGSDSSTVQPTSQTSDISGTWNGTATSSVISGFVNITMTISQSGSYISGEYICTTESISCLHSSGTISGTVSGTSFTSSIVFPDGHSCSGMNGTISDTSMSGNYSCTDPAGNDNGTWSATKQSPSPIDTTPSFTSSVTINAGAERTTSNSATLTLSATSNINTNIAAYYISIEGIAPSINDPGWVSITPTTNYSADVSYTLTGGYGSKVVSVWFEDVDGNISDATSDSIYFSPWVAAAPMSIERYEHTATLLQDGRVLVVGGDSTAKILNSAEIYDPATNTWTSAASMSMQRQGHFAILLNNGKVLVFAGGTTSAELYDPATNTWSNAGDITINGKVYGTAFLLSDGRVLVLAGSTNGASSIYNPATNSWASVSYVINTGSTATLLSNEKVLVAGGLNSEDAAQIYDPATDSSAVAASLNVGRWTHTAIQLINDKVLVLGGVPHTGGYSLSSTEIYDPITNTWNITGSLITPRSYGATAELLQSGKVLVVGGGVFPVEIYDPTTGVWSEEDRLITYRQETTYTSTLLKDGRVLIAGGHSGIDVIGILSSTEIYTPH